MTLDLRVMSLSSTLRVKFTEKKKKDKFMIAVFYLSVIINDHFFKKLYAPAFCLSPLGLFLTVSVCLFILEILFGYLVFMDAHSYLRTKKLGTLGWLSWLNVRILISTQVMTSG